MGADSAVSGQVMRVAWYRFTATFGRRRGGYVAIVLLIGLAGGIAMGSIAAADPGLVCHVPRQYQPL